ncbi:alpha/beta hydrolase [Crossiella cryophila]|uniref:Pimeloyl-ACP methyl ester carboxylesterase n=1 Tax=Crossiella cryophila TaxID=43355 RepID=A0A7W7CHS5_9PSEU|nr:alpha/beta hydrolase [Crossiella cryophila]MBB4681212.1 pimeloyl-ACP methyl ester carboxylesterase [Crossiella cryophila]
MTGRRVVVVPGSSFGPYAPLLKFTADAAEARGAQLNVIEWTPDDSIKLGSAARAEFVLAQVEPVLAAAAAHTDSVLVTGKSLGTHTASPVADHGWPAIWHTPLLTDPEVRTALARTTAPFLLIGGTRDHWWDGELARRLTPHVLEVEDADHGMYVPGPLSNSAAVLGQVATKVEAFLDTIDW